jgi:hypothetical protein
MEGEVMPRRPNNLVKFSKSGGVSKRPVFNANAKAFARLNHNEQPGAEPVTRKTNLNNLNAAMPHRMSWKDIRDNTARFASRKESPTDFERWTDRFIEAGAEKISHLDKGSALHKAAKTSHAEFQVRRDAFMRDRGNPKKRELFEKSANQYFANVPDLGPHFGVNNVVGELAHLNVVERGRGRIRSPSDHTREFTPMSRRVLDMSPGRLSGVAVTSGGELIDVRGKTHARNTANFSQTRLDQIDGHGPSAVPSFRPGTKGPFK